MNILRRVQPVSLSPFEEVNFFVVDLENIHSDEIPEAKSLLQEDAIAYSLRFKFEKDQHRSLLSHSILRHYLGQFLQTDPLKIKIERTKFGKPYIKDTPIHFNLSHTNRFAFFAINFSKPIGVDIEFIERGEEILKIADHFLDFSEKQHIAHSSKPINMFFSYWCAKEAILKAQGIGLSTEKMPVFNHPILLSKTCLFFTSDNFKVYVYDEIVKEHKIAVCLYE